MITVNILINGQAIFTRSAHRRTSRHNKGSKYAYLLDDGTELYHEYDSGAVALAIEMLKTIKEFKTTAKPEGKPNE
jgi:hypothetical protein